MSTEVEQELQDQRRLVEVALGAYNAVWQAWPRLDAETVEDCRRVAMSAAIGAFTLCRGDRG